MIQISYPLDSQTLDSVLEDEIERLMNDADYDICGDGWRNGMRSLEFEGDTAEDDREFNQLSMVHLQLKDLNSEIVWEVDVD